MMRPDLFGIYQFTEAILDRTIEKGVIDDGRREIKEKVVRGVLSNTEFLKRSLEISKRLTEEQTKAVERAGYLVMSGLFKLTTDGLVGIGGGPFKPIFEVGLTIDPILGLPYYPGSGIKGAVRAYMENELCPRNRPECLGPIFGEPGEGGHESLVVFLDALPVGCSENCPYCSIYTGMITNPHYFKGGKVVETELEVVPTPIVYIGISKCLVFRITVGVNELLFDAYKVKINKLTDLLHQKANISINNARDLLRVIGMYTIRTLRRGVAAKAAKGYNVLEIYEGTLSFNIKKVEFGISKKVRKGEVLSSDRPSHTTRNYARRGRRGGGRR